MKTIPQHKGLQRVLLGFAVITLLMGMGFHAAGQPQYTLNFPTVCSTTAIPFMSNTNNKAQWLFYHTDFSSAPSGYINKIYFRNDVIMLPVLCNFTDFQIRMGQSTLTALPPGPWINTGMNTTFSANNFQVWPLTGNWIPVTLQTPFYYDNTKNFIVEASHASYSVGFMLMQASMTARNLYGNITSLMANSQNYLCDLGFDITQGSTDASLEDFITPGDSICSGAQPVTVTLKNNGPAVLTNTAIQWKVNNIAQPTFSWTGSLAPQASTSVTLGNYTFLPSTTASATAWTTNPNNLPDNNTSNDTLTNGNIWVNPAPSAFPASSIPYSVCLGDSLIIPINITGTPPWFLEYLFGTVPYQIQQNTSPFIIALKVTILANTSVLFTSVKDATGCSSPTLPAISIQTKPVPSVSLGPDQAVKASGNVFLDAGPGFITYLWSTGATTQTITLPGHTLGPGTHPFWVRVTNSGGCSATDTIMVTIIDDVGFPETGKPHSFLISPNPSNGVVEISLKEPVNAGVSLEIFSSDGKLLAGESRYLWQSSPVIQLDLRHLPQGVYLLRLTSATASDIRKLVIQQ